MYQPWKWLKRGNYSFFSHCRIGTKLLLALKVSLDDFSPELQYLPKKQNSGFLYVPIEHKEMSQKIKIRLTNLKIKNNYKATHKSIDCLYPFPYLFSVLLPMTLWGCNCFNLIFQMQTKACERECLAETHF